MEDLFRRDSCTVRVWFTSNEVQPDELAVVCEQRQEDGDGLFFIGEVEDAVVIHVPGVETELRLEKETLKGNERDIAIVKRGASVAVWANGSKGSGYGQQNPARGMDYAAPLVFGSQSNGHNHWNGTIRSFAWYHRSMNDSEVVNLAFGGQDHGQNVSFDFTTPAQRSVDSSETTAQPAVVVPEAFIPCRRMTLQSIAEYFDRPRIYLSDSTLNILLFVPVGFLGISLFSRRRRHKPLPLIAVLLCGFAFSLIIELLQAYIPARYSAWTDVLTNSLGVFGGCVLFNVNLRYNVLDRGLSMLGCGCGTIWRPFERSE